MSEDTMTPEASDAASAAVAVAPRVSLEDIERNIRAQYMFTGSQAIGDEVPGMPELDVLTICLLICNNGFVVVGKAAPASPENFDPVLGAKFAKEDAIRQLWPLMGYALREQLMLEAFAGED